jgi:hypothetical protein
MSQPHQLSHKYSVGELKLSDAQKSHRGLINDVQTARRHDRGNWGGLLGSEVL